MLTGLDMLSHFQVFESVHSYHLRASDEKWMEVFLLLPTLIHYQILCVDDVQQEVVLLEPVLQVGDLPPAGCITPLV